MSIPYRARPGAGFVLVLTALLSSVAFFAWGLRTPPLERFWRLQIELEVGRGRDLSNDELRLMQAVLAAHPGLADNMLDGAAAGLVSAQQDGVVDAGWAYLVRESPAQHQLLRVVTALPTETPVPIRARTVGHKARGEATAERAFEWRLPDDGPFPQLIEVTVAGPGKRKGKRAAVPILVSFGAAP